MMRRAPRRIVRHLACGGGLAVVVAGLVVCGSVAQARAELTHQLGGLGPALVELVGEPGAQPAEHTLTLNGAAIAVRSESVAAGVDVVLRDAEARCGGDAGGALSTTLAAWAPEGGFVGCFPALRDLGPRALVAAAELLVAGGDARALGPFVYTYARRTARGAHVVTATLRELDLGAMFPARGDAPGADVDGVPRPDATRRILSVELPDHPYRVVVYVVDGADVAAVAAGYHAGLEAAGWELRAVASADGRRVAYGFRGDAVAAIVVRPDAAGVTVTVGLLL